MQALPEELQAARLRVVAGHPYLAAALYALQTVALPGLGTLAVDQHWRLYYDAAAMAEWSAAELAGVLIHEVSHLLRGHARRGEEMQADPNRWNLAADAEINDDLLAERVALPDWVVTPAKLGQPDGRLAEEYYAALAGDASPQQQGGADDEQEGDASATARTASSTTASAPSRKGGASSKGGSPVRKGGASGLHDTPRPAAGRCGSAAHGHPEPWELPSPAEGGPPGVTDTEAELVRRQVAEAVRNAASSTSRGSVPAHWRRWAEEVLRPAPVDWRRELAAAIRRAAAQVAGATDYSYRRPSRHQSGDIILPTLSAPVPEVAVVVDTSGSVADTMLGQALAQVGCILRACGMDRGVTILAVDAEVATCQRVYRPTQIKVAGGGGTDMRVGIQAAMALRPRPDVVVVFTDGYTPWPEQPPAARVVVGLLGAGAPTPPSWARVVRI